MILPESIFPGSTSAPADGFSSIVTPAVQSRITIAPAPVWVRAQELDESYRPVGGLPSTWLLLDEQYHAGLREHFSHTVQRLETLSAVRASSQWRFDFDPATQEVVIHSLVVRRDGIAAEHAQPERLRFLQREEQLDQYLMHGQVTVLVLLEDVRPGDVLDVSLTTRRHSRLLRDRFWFFVSVPSTIPLRMCRFSICFPSGRPFAWKAYSPEFAPAIEEADGETTWLWTAENTVALEPEAQVPTWVMPPLWLQVSDCASWGEVISAVREVWQEALYDPELTRKVEEFALAAETLAQRVEMALDFVQDEIRYLSVNIELGGQIPAPPGEVLRRRYGDCKDKSFLLSQMLRRLGIPARPVLVNAEWRNSVQDLLPTPDLFNHAVVEYELDGCRFWADATLNLQGGGARHRPVPDLRLGLPLSPDAQGLEPAPASAAESAYELHETYYLDSTDRPSQLVVQMVAHGANAEDLRRVLVSEGAEAVAKSREQLYRQMFEVSRLMPLEWQDDRPRNVFTMGIAFELPTAVARIDQIRGARFNFRTHLIASVFAFPNTPERRLPLALPFPCQVEQRVTIVSTAAPPQEIRPGHERKTAFEVRYHPTHGVNRWGIAIKVRMLRDFVPARLFEKHKEWLSGLAPLLSFEMRLPMHSSSLWDRLAPRSLLPAVSLPQIEPEMPCASRTLPAEPAPALASLAQSPSPSPVTARPPAEARVAMDLPFVHRPPQTSQPRFPNRAAIAVGTIILYIFVRMVATLLTQ